MLLIVRVASAHDKELFVLQYNVDNLLPGHVSLRSGSDPDLQTHLDGILRFKDDRRPQIKTLTLTVQHPVPIWTSRPQRPTREPGSHSSYRRFVDLVKATTMHIVFDYKFFSQEHQAPFKAFSKASKDLAVHPVRQFLSDHGLRETSWTDLSPVDDVGAPPAYVKPRKRVREASTPSSPPQKRSTLQSPTRSTTSDATDPNSPVTAEAISAAFLRGSAINAIPCEQLSDHLQDDLVQTTPKCSTPDSELNKLHTALRSPSFSPPQSPPEPPLLTPWGSLLVSQLRTLLANEFQREQTRQYQRFEKLLDRLSDAAEDARAHETAEVEEYLEEHKLDLRVAKDDCFKELSADVDALYAEGRQQCLDLHDDLTEMLESTFGDMCDRIEAIKRVELERMVATAVKKHGCRCRGVKRGVVKSSVKSDRKLLGRRREAEWEDC